MSDVERGNQGGMSLTRALGIYIACFFGLLLLFSITHNVHEVPRSVGVIGYVAEGIFLSRVVLRRLIEWHPMYNTIGNVASAKLSTIAFWPISYPILFFKLFVTKHL
ncbi:TPA: hypothetical protein QDA99_001443 [Burkholderia vietnamiensis]|nr:hypothetical protein [Burkholderia vietnamiensis]